MYREWKVETGRTAWRLGPITHKRGSVNHRSISFSFFLSSFFFHYHRWWPLMLLMLRCWRMANWIRAENDDDEKWRCWWYGIAVAGQSVKERLVVAKLVHSLLYTTSQCSVGRWVNECRSQVSGSSNENCSGKKERKGGRPAYSIEYSNTTGWQYMRVWPAYIHNTRMNILFFPPHSLIVFVVQSWC